MHVHRRGQPRPASAQGRPVQEGEWVFCRRRVTRSDYNPIKPARVMYRRPSVSSTVAASVAVVVDAVRTIAIYNVRHRNRLGSGGRSSRKQRNRPLQSADSAPGTRCTMDSTIVLVPVVVYGTRRKQHQAAGALACARRRSGVAATVSTWPIKPTIRKRYDVIDNTGSTKHIATAPKEEEPRP